MVAGEASAEAIALARAHPTLAVGLHLVVVDGRPVLPPSEIPSLVDAVGRFPARPFSAGLRYQFSASAASTFAERFARSWNAFNTPVFCSTTWTVTITFTFIQSFSESSWISPRSSRSRRIRLPSEELGLALSLDPRGKATKILWSVVFGFLHRHARRLLQERRIGFHQRVYGLLATGRITEEYLLGLIPRIQAESVEIYCHPAAALPG